MTIPAPLPAPFLWDGRFDRTSGRFGADRWPISAESAGKRLLFGVNRHRAWQVIKECAEKAGLPKLLNPDTGRVHNVSPHRLRDSFAVHAVKTNDSGDGIRMLQQHLGHQSFNTTMKYRKVSGKEHGEWYQNLWKNKTATGYRPKGNTDD